MTTTYEAEQDRPKYWDDLPHARRANDGRNGDWRMSSHRVFKSFATIEAAERYARRILGQRPGQPVTIWRRSGVNSSGSLAQDRVAIVSKDALDRTWTDLVTMEPLL